MNANKPPRLHHLPGFSSTRSTSGSAPSHGRVAILVSLLLFSLFSGHPTVVASPGTPLELVFPKQTAAISASAQSVAMNDQFILVGLPSVNEVQVFSATTGKFIRRIRPPASLGASLFGSLVAISGNRAFILDLNSRVNAFDLASGQRLWSYSPQADNNNGPITLKSGVVYHLAADGNRVTIGMPTAWLFNDPLFGRALSEGMVGRADAATGAPNSALNAFTGETNARFGWTTAVSGDLTLIGEPYRDHASLAESGRVTMATSNTPYLEMGAPAPVAGDNFGDAVAIAGNHLMVSAPLADHSGKNDFGRVYVYDKATLALLTQVNAPSALATGARFGDTLAAQGPVACIGANGSAWLYDLVGNALTRLTPPQAATGKYGVSVAICSHSCVVADPDATGGTAAKGRVYLFKNFGRAFPASSVIASTSLGAPGTSTGTVFSAFQHTAVSTSGAVLHQATVKGGGTTSATNGGVWGNHSGTHQLQLREGHLVDGRKIGAPFLPFYAPDGSARFVARKAGTGQQVLFKHNGISLTKLLSEGQVVDINNEDQTIAKLLDIVGTTRSGVDAVLAYRTKTGVNGVTSATDSRIGRIGGVIFNEDAREGDFSPIGGVRYGQLPPRVSSEDTRIAFVAALSGTTAATNSALITRDLSNGTTSVVVRKGDTAVGTGNATFRTFASAQLHGGQAIYRATVAGGNPGVTTGLWRLTSPVALRLQQAPGCPTGVKFGSFIDYFNPGGVSVIFRARVTGPGVTAANDVGVWLYTPTQTYLLLREGGFLPGGGSQRIGVIQRLDVDKSGKYAVLVSVAGAPPARNQALLTGVIVGADSSRWVPGVALQKGIVVDRPAGITTLLGLALSRNHIDATGAGSRGQAKQMSAAGVAFTARYSPATDLMFLDP